MKKIIESDDGSYRAELPPDNIEFVQYQARFYRLNHHLPFDHAGRASLWELTGDGGVLAPWSECTPASDQCAKAIVKLIGTRLTQPVKP